MAWVGRRIAPPCSPSLCTQSAESRRCAAQSSGGGTATNLLGLAGRKRQRLWVVGRQQLAALVQVVQGAGARVGEHHTVGLQRQERVEALGEEVQLLRRLLIRSHGCQMRVGAQALQAATHTSLQSRRVQGLRWHKSSFAGSSRHGLWKTPGRHSTPDLLPICTRLLDMRLGALLLVAGLLLLCLPAGGVQYVNDELLWTKQGWEDYKLGFPWQVFAKREPAVARLLEGEPWVRTSLAGPLGDIQAEIEKDMKRWVARDRADQGRGGAWRWAAHRPAGPAHLRGQPRTG